MKATRSYLISITSCVLLALTSMVAASPASAEGEAEERMGADAPFVTETEKVPEETRVEIPLSGPRSLADAVMIKQVSGYPVVAFRFENDEIVGEFAVDGPSRVDEYLRNFFDVYGTQPQIVAAVVVMPVEEAEKRSTQRTVQEVVAPGSIYDAPAVDELKIDALLEGFRANRPDAAATGAVEARTGSYSTWKPTQAEMQIFRINSSTVYFSQFYWWDGYEAHNTALHPDDGWEGEINIYTNHADYQSGTRGGDICGAAGSSSYKDRPFAKNHSWNWFALVNTGGGMGPVASNVGAYADYNDLSDPCNRSSMAIGIRTPQNIPWYAGDYSQEVMLTIQAPRGLDNTGKISGVVQAVNETGCNLAPWLSSTDCMGLTASTAGHRTTLNVSRAWTAPSRCWTSFDYGSATPVSYTC